MGDKKRVFVASSSDLKKERKELKELLYDEGFKPELWENIDHSITDEEFQDRVNNKHLIKSDIVIFMIKSKLGKFTKEEFDLVYNKLSHDDTLRMYVYIFPGDTSKDDFDELIKINDLKKQLEEDGKLWISTKNSLELKNHFLQQIKHINKKKINKIDFYASVPNLITKLPEYLSRDNDMIMIKQILLDDGDSNRALCLHGMGGIGKSIFAIALANDKDVREYFKDGIYFIKLGQNPDIPSIQIDLLYYLNIDTIEPTLAKLRNAFSNKKALLIIDDIWSIKDYKYFDIVNNKSKLLITTRQKNIGTALHTKNYYINILSEEQSILLLEKKVGDINKDMLGLAKIILNKCGYLPLAISIIGSILKGKDNLWWEKVLYDLKTERLQKIKFENENEEHENLYKVIDLSVNYLNKSTKNKYLSLSIFYNTSNIYRATLEIYWGEDYLEYIDELISFSLIIESKDNQDRVIYTMHDLQMYYIQYMEEDINIQYKNYINSYQIKYLDNWFNISLDDVFFYNKYIEISKRLNNKKLRKEITKNLILYKEFLDIEFILKVTKNGYLSSLYVAEKVLQNKQTVATIFWCLSVLSINNEIVQSFSKNYLKKKNINTHLAIKCLNILEASNVDVKVFAKKYLNLLGNNSPSPMGRNNMIE